MSMRMVAWVFCFLSLLSFGEEGENQHGVVDDGGNSGTRLCFWLFYSLFPVLPWGSFYVAGVSGGRELVFVDGCVSMDCAPHELGEMGCMNTNHNGLESDRKLRECRIEAFSTVVGLRAEKR